MITLENRRYFKCSLEDRLSCVSLIEEIMELSNTARRHGLLALEEKAGQMSNDFLASGIMLIVDGTDPCLVREMMTTRAIASHEVGLPLLCRAIIVEGLLSIQAGENPLVVTERLYCLLGEDAIAIVKNKAVFPFDDHDNETSELERTADKFSKIIKAMQAAEETADLSRISDETLANLFLFIEPKMAALIISSLPSERQADIIKLLDSDDKQDINLAYELKDMLDENLIFGKVKKMSRKKRVMLIAEILNVVDRGTERNIFMRLENEAAELAEEIRHQMFVLDDLMLLDDRAIQRVLRDLSDEDLAMALKNASEETRALFFGNMSARAADMLRENMDVASERPEDIEAAQQRIINTVRLLEERAEIVISNSRKWR